MRAVDRVLEQAAGDGGCLIEVPHGLEQRADVQGDLTRSIDAARRPRQEQHAERVVCALGHRDDVGAEGLGPELLEGSVQGAEDLEGSLRLPVEGSMGRRSMREGGAEEALALLPRALGELGVPEQLPDRAPVHLRILAHVQRGQVEANGLDAPPDAPHERPARVPSLVGAEAVRDQGQVVLEPLRRPIAPLAGDRRGFEAVGDQPQQPAVRHLPVATRDGGVRGREARGVVLDPPGDLRGHADPARRLAEVFVELAQVLPVAPQGELSVSGQGLPDRVGAHVRVAVHVAADPGGELDQWACDLDGLPEHIAEGALDLLVEGGDDPVEHVGEVEEHVLDLLGDGRLARELLLGLPGGGDLQGDLLVEGREGDGLELVLGEARDQGTGQALLLLEQGAPHRLGGVGGEHRLEAHPLQGAARLRGRGAGVAQGLRRRS